MFSMFPRSTTNSLKSVGPRSFAGIISKTEDKSKHARLSRLVPVKLLKDNADLNQYWYSQATIEVMAAEVREFGSGGTAFLSTPSIFFSLEEDLRANCKLFDLDTKWAKDPGFVRYDFTEPEHLPEDARGSFDMVVVDPPFITREVWEKYATATRLLLRPGGARVVLCSSISENASFMNELLGVTPCEFKPSIPNLVYQYQLFANYRSERLGVANPEIPADDDDA